MKYDEITAQLKEYFRNRSVLLAYLFGSRALEKGSVSSDYDIGILCPASNPETFYEIGHELTLMLGTAKVDVVSLSAAPLELQYKIIKEGVLLYEKDKYNRVEFEANVLSRYFDFVPVLRRQRQEILEERKDGKRIQRYREALGQTLRMLGQIRTP